MQCMSSCSILRNQSSSLCTLDGVLFEFPWSWKSCSYPKSYSSSTILAVSKLCHQSQSLFIRAGWPTVSEFASSLIIIIILSRILVDQCSILILILDRCIYIQIYDWRSGSGFYDFNSYQYYYDYRSFPASLLIIESKSVWYVAEWRRRLRSEECYRW
jgi:hypothetical protein